MPGTEAGGQKSSPLHLLGLSGATQEVPAPRRGCGFNKSGAETRAKAGEQEISLFGSRIDISS